jgi:prophage antirepressor-like protein
MDALQVFNYEKSEVRTTQRNGETWWVLKDVCAILEIGNSRMVSDRLDDDEKGVSIIDTLGGKQELTVISESGLYNVILLSRKPEAKKFKRWVTHAVLPSIRKHGMYATEAIIDKILADPDFGIRLLTELKDEKAKTAALAIQNEDLKVELNDAEKFWTIMKFNQHFNLKWDMDTCQRNGRRASTYSRQRGYVIKKCKTNDERFKETNSYVYEVLDQLFLKESV